MFDEEFWEERYRSRESVWSGDPNPQLVADVTGLTPGTALDVGCGEGADAVWLAGQGWQVTGLDVSSTALTRAAGHAAERGVADRISWQQADLTAWHPSAGYDLVSAQFIHPPAELREQVVAALFAAVAPGGRLVFAGHHRSDLETTIGRPPVPEMLFTETELAELVPAEGWSFTAEARPRQVRDAEGCEVTVHDAALVARREG